VTRSGDAGFAPCDHARVTKRIGGEAPGLEMPVAPERRTLRQAVGWMLGPDLAAQLRQILRKRQEPRDWMAYYRGFLHDESRHCDGRLIRARDGGGVTGEDLLEAAPAQRSEGEEIEAAEEDAAARRAPARAVRRAPSESEVVWFDYISDIGDGSDAMYAVAYACQVDFEREPDGTVRVWRKADREEHGRAGNLPRGQFLFVGGDVAYHLSDEVTVRGRVQEPFDWAWTDLGEDRAEPPRASEPRLYGIPGNHDWYDNLHGFSLLIRRGDHDKTIALRGFKRVQLGSYVAIDLPHGWQLWGLDIDTTMDVRQERYFASLRSESGGEPEKLVLCTPSPPIAFGDVHPNDKHRNAIERLGLTPAYLPERRLETGCRLDLAGDMHHYARYAKDEAPKERQPYMAVVSGLGGAFHHPTFTRQGPHEPAEEYPKPDESRDAVAAGLLHPRSVLVGSWVRVVPFLLAILFGFASTSAGGVGWLLGEALARVPGIEVAGSAGDAGQLWRAALLVAVLVAAGVAAWLGTRLFAITSEAHATDPGRKRSFFEAPWGFGRGAKLDPLRSYWLLTFVAIFVVVGLFAFGTSGWAPAPATAAIDAGTILVVLVLLLGCGVGTWVQGAKHLHPAWKVALTAIALVHATLQLAVPLFWARLATSSGWTVAAAVGVWLATWTMLMVTRVPFRRRSAALVAVVWLGTAVGGVAAMIAASGGELVPSVGPFTDLGRFALGGLAAMPLATSHLTWFLAVAGLLDGHNNEVGGAARVTSYRQIIRFRVDRDGLTGHVIAIEHEKATRTLWPRLRELVLSLFREDARDSPARRRGENLTYRLVDRFTIAR
jgi:hypothetical protein